jgi:putative peptide zinc metalloprotease protein
MRKYTADTVVSVDRFTRQVEGEETTIGHSSNTETFLALPSEAVELLDHLSTGKTIGEVQNLYQIKYGEIPDIADLLSVLESKGFIYSSVTEKDQTNTSVRKIIYKKNIGNKSSRFHFENIPQSLAQKIFSKWNLIFAGICIGLALLAAISDPSIIPGWNAYFFQSNLAFMRLCLMLIGFLTLFLHEMAHLTAARALGVSSRLGISNRMWILVAETDMTGIWSVPRKQRYLPFLAGPLLDAFCASLLTLTFFFHSKKLIELPIIFEQIGKAMLLSYLLGLLWQCYLFVRTDFYFVIANFFRCKNLMKDTEIFLYNQFIRFICSRRQISQSHIPHSERRVIKFYAVFWILGRAIAFYSLIFISFPLIWNYSFKFFTIFKAGYLANPSAFMDTLFVIGIIFGPQAYGLWLWIRSFYKKEV